MKFGGGLDLMREGPSAPTDNAELVYNPDDESHHCYHDPGSEDQARSQYHASFLSTPHKGHSKVPGFETPPLPTNSSYTSSIDMMDVMVSVSSAFDNDDTCSSLDDVVLDTPEDEPDASSSSRPSRARTMRGSSLLDDEIATNSSSFTLQPCFKESILSCQPQHHRHDGTTSPLDSTFQPGAVKLPSQTNGHDFYDGMCDLLLPILDDFDTAMSYLGVGSSPTRRPIVKPRMKAHLASWMFQD